MLSAVALLVLTVITELINPYGIGQIELAYHILFDPISKYISEWKPPVFTSWYLIALLVLPFVLLLFNAVKNKQLKIDIFNLLFVFFMLYEFLGSVRHTAMFGLSVFILFAELFKPIEQWLKRVFDLLNKSNLINKSLLIWTIRGLRS